MHFSVYVKMKICFLRVSAHHNLVRSGDKKAMEDFTLNPGFVQMESGKFEFCKNWQTQ